VQIIDKWLLPFFNQKLSQTISKRREPNWFKEYLVEWNVVATQLIHDISYTDGSNWVCSCPQFKLSCFYICKHLVLQSKKTLKFRTELNIQDSYPFVSFTKDYASELSIQSKLFSNNN
jgi:hypothetical protein